MTAKWKFGDDMCKIVAYRLLINKQTKKKERKEKAKAQSNQITSFNFFGVGKNTIININDYINLRIHNSITDTNSLTEVEGALH